MLPDNKAARSKIARNRSVSASSASAKSKVGNRAVVVNRVAVSKADDKPGYLGLSERRERLPPLLMCATRQNEEAARLASF